MENNTKGYLFTIISVVLVSFTVIFNTLALAEGLRPEIAALFMFMFAFSMSGTTLLIKGEFGKVISSFMKYRKQMTTMGILNGLAALSFFIGLSILGPSILMFLLRFATVIIVILSIVFLKEKFIPTEIVGAVITIIGAIMITYSSGGVILNGIIFALLASVFFASSQVISKMYIKKVKPSYMNNIRHFFMFVTVLTFALLTKGVEIPGTTALIYLFLGAILGPVVAFYLHFRSIEIADLSKISLIRSLEPFTVVILAMIVLGEVLTSSQMLGGLVTVIGVLIIGFSRYKPKAIARWISSGLIHFPISFIKKKFRV